MTGYQSKKKAAQDKLVMTPEQKKIYEDGFLAGQEQLIKSSVHRAVHGLAQPAQPHCQCSACKDGKLHLSDCAVHNDPAYPAGPCDCGVLNQQIAQPAQDKLELVDYEKLAALGWQAIECPFCGSSGAQAFPKPVAQPAQEPKSVTYKEVADTMNALRKGNFSQQAAAKEVGKLKLYTAPPQRTWVGLTDEEGQRIVNSCQTGTSREIFRAIEQALKEKNNGT